MKIIKKLALCALFSNVAYSADLPELPEDHPIKTAMQVTKHMFYQDSGTSGYIDMMFARWGCGGHRNILISLFSGENIKNIESVVIRNWKECIDSLFIRDNIEEYFFICSYFEKSVSREHSYAPRAQHRFSCNIGETIDALKCDIDTYIHKSFEVHFNNRMEDKKFASACKLALVYRGANTAHVENTAKANRWIAEIQAKATEEVEYAAELCAALYFSPLREKQHENARRIIESFPPESDPRIRLQSAFNTVLTRPTPPIPTGDRLIVYREIEAKLFGNNDDA